MSTVTTDTSTPEKIVTLGDVADVLRGLLAQGVTLGSLRYATERVYWQEMHAEEEQARRFEAISAQARTDREASETTV